MKEKRFGLVFILGVLLPIYIFLSCKEDVSTNLTEKQISGLSSRADTIREKFSYVDSVLITEACGSTPIPTLNAEPFILFFPSYRIFKYNDSIISSCNPYKLLPFLLYESIYYTNKVDLKKDHLDKFHYHLSDFTICNINSFKNYFSSKDLKVLANRYENSIKQFYPEYEYVSVHPFGDEMIPHATIDRRPNALDSLRVYALIGNQKALDSLVSILRKKNSIEEIAFIYFFKAIAEDNPDYFYTAAKHLYEVTDRYPNALSIAFDFLKEGEKRNSEKCIRALEKWRNYADSSAPAGVEDVDD